MKISHFAGSGARSAQQKEERRVVVGAGRERERGC